MKLKTFKKEDEWVEGVLDLLREICKNKEGMIHIALSGGTTPAPVYRAIARSDLPLDRIAFYQVDERYVPSDHPSSNNDLIKGSLHRLFYHFDTTLPIPFALAKYEDTIRDVTFDLVILGIGPDGHTASLFPDSPALESQDLLEHTTTDQFDVRDRLTMTFEPIMKSRSILVLLKGKEKKTILNRLRRSRLSARKLPAKKLLKHKNLHIYFANV